MNKASISGLVNLDLIPRQVELIKLKLVFTAFLFNLILSIKMGNVENKPASFLAVLLEKALREFPNLNGGQVAGNKEIQ